VVDLFQAVLAILIVLVNFYIFINGCFIIYSIHIVNIVHRIYHNMKSRRLLKLRNDFTQVSLENFTCRCFW